MLCLVLLVCVCVSVYECVVEGGRGGQMGRSVSIYSRQTHLPAHTTTTPCARVRICVGALEIDKAQPSM